MAFVTERNSFGFWKGSPIAQMVTSSEVEPFSYLNILRSDSHLVQFSKFCFVTKIFGLRDRFSANENDFSFSETRKNSRIVNFQKIFRPFRLTEGNHGKNIGYCWRSRFRPCLFEGKKKSWTSQLNKIFFFFSLSVSRP